MATNTTNFNLSKPAYADTADIAVINSNMDKVDTSLQGLGAGIAIMSKANTHAAISKGQFVYIHGHSSLAEGLYKARSNISANATLSSSNVQAASNILSELREDADKALEDKLDKSVFEKQSFTANTPLDVVVGTGFRGYMFCSSPSVSCNGILEIHSNTSGNPNFNKVVGELSGLTVSGSTSGRRTLTFIGNTYTMIMVMNGSLSIETTA